MYAMILEIFQSQKISCTRNVISIDTPSKTICSEESGLAGLILPDAIIKKFGGSLGDANEKMKLPFSITIESEENNSTTQKYADQWDNHLHMSY